MRGYFVPRMIYKFSVQVATIKKPRKNEVIRTVTDGILIGIIAALYVLGARQGAEIAEAVDEVLAQTDEKLNTAGRMLLIWGWPYATLRVIISGEDNG